MSFKTGDIVGRKSYGLDILFTIININEKGALLKGVGYRLLADAPLEDLDRPSAEKLKEYKNNLKEMEKGCIRNINTRRRLELEKMRKEHNDEDFIEMPGKVLHLDGDREYLSECLRAYVSLGIKVTAKYCPEEKQPHVVLNLLKELQPDMLVLTGHDSFNKKMLKQNNFHSLDSYRYSRYYIEAVKAARKYEPGKDDLIIFAGGCQSYYEALLEAGANFASSPRRILIHALDPVFVIEKICYTSINKSVDVREVMSSTITGFDGLGGIETRGKFRLSLPRSPY